MVPGVVVVPGADIAHYEPFIFVWTTLSTYILFIGLEGWPFYTNLTTILASPDKPKI